MCHVNLTKAARQLGNYLSNDVSHLRYANAVWLRHHLVLRDLFLLNKVLTQVIPNKRVANLIHHRLVRSSHSSGYTQA